MLEKNKKFFNGDDTYLKAVVLYGHTTFLYKDEAHKVKVLTSEFAEVAQHPLVVVMEGVEYRPVSVKKGETDYDVTIVKTSGSVTATTLKTTEDPKAKG